MIFNVDKFHKKQEHDFGLDGWGVVSDSNPKKILTQDEKSYLISKMRKLENKAAMLKGQRCNCFHSDGSYDLGIEHTCSYHQAIFDIRSIKSELDIYKILEHREYRHFSHQIHRELKLEQFAKASPFILISLIFVVLTFCFIF